MSIAANARLLGNLEGAPSATPGLVANAEADEPVGSS